MQCEIEVGGRPRRVTVSRAGGAFAVSIDGRLHRVDAVRIDAHTISLIVDGVWQRDTVIAPEGQMGRLVVGTAAVPVTVSLNARRQRHRAVDGGAFDSGPMRVSAPMPGKIVRVLVNTGDAVHANQPIVVVEAMKMENELRTERDGTVAEIHTREGMSVEAGTLLVVIQ